MENLKYRSPRLLDNRCVRCLFLLIFLISLVLHPHQALAYSKGEFVVNSMLDLAPTIDFNPGDGICATSGGVCTLRAAIQEANALSGADTILFAASVSTVIVQTALPALTDSTGGTTISGGIGYVYILGNLAGSDTNGFTINSNNNKIQGLDIVGFLGNGIVINGDFNTIGVDGDGINDVAEHNIIRENNLNGILINSTGDNNKIAGNSIGIDRLSASKPNTLNGIQISGSNTLVGVSGNGISDDLETNRISFNSQDGIYITNNNNSVRGNQITSNSKSGVRVFGSSLNKIGTNGDGSADVAEGNLISGNLEYGVYIYQTSETIVAGNKIGTDSAGSAAFFNRLSGIYIWDSQASIIGTDGSGVGASSEGNLISGNTIEGIKIQYGGGNTIAGNKIGTNLSGTAALKNGGGIYIDRSNFNFIGTNSDGVGDALEGNIISGNHVNGLTITGVGSVDNVVAGNRIGISADGISSLANGKHGVILAPNANNNLVGTNGDGLFDILERNIISGNTDCGLMIKGNQNQIAGNFIGLNEAGTTAIANLNYGLCIVDGQANLIGTNGDSINDSGEANVISGNQNGGILIQQITNDTVANNIFGNKIGTTASGSSPLPNIAVGVFLQNVKDNRIGLPSTPFGNIIAFHLSAGILFTSVQPLTGNQFVGNSMYGNLLGIDLGGNGVTYNDVGDSDSGPNGLLNFPIIYGAESTGDTISIAVSYNSRASKTYGLDFYWSRTCNITGYGEGQVYLGYSPVTTNASGNVGPLQIGLSTSLNRTGFITATATDSDGATSEFSQCVPLEGISEYTVYLPALIR